MTTYTRLLRLTAVLAITAFALMVTCADSDEPREPWEFVPVEVQR